MWCPELKNVPTKFIHEPWKMPTNVQNEIKVVMDVNYPNPIKCPKYTDINWKPRPF